MPVDFPAGRFDLIVLSEFLYYFAPADLKVVAQQCVRALDRGLASILLVPEIGLTPQMAGVLDAAFGARVALRDAKGGEQVWQIVGVDEIDLRHGRISWISPLARALLDRKVGEMVAVGDQRLTLQKIE